MKMKLALDRWVIHITVITAVIVCNMASAEDWQTYQHDNRRSGVTSERLSSTLYEQWRYSSRHEPQPAWPLPAKQDFWHNMYELRTKIKYDRTFHVVAVGDAVYFSSSADDKIYCLDASTGEERWAFFTEGPVRFAPTVWDEKSYVGSDDGCVYCLDAKNGELIWKYRALPIDRKIPGNGRMISVCPIRTGVIVEDGIAYFGAGLFPKESVYLCAINARNGTEIWKKPATISPQGYLLASKTRLYVPTGRTAPAIFDREDGKVLGSLTSHRDGGGTYALLTKETLISGPGTKLREFDAESRDQIATFTGRRMIVTAKTSYLLSDNELSAIDRAMYSTAKKLRSTIAEERKNLASKLSEMREQRKDLSGQELKTLDGQIDEIVKKMEELDKQLKELVDVEYKWRRSLDSPYHSMILTDDLLFAGRDDEVVGFRVADGEQVWKSKVMGKSYGLAVANGRLFVSTDKGVIHCFGESSTKKPRKIIPAKNPSPYPEDDLTKNYKSASDKLATCSTAARIVKAAELDKGYCLVLGCDEGRLAYEIAQLTDLKIVAIDEDAESVATARKALDQAGVYGVQVSVHHGSLTDLPYTDYFANLIVSDRVLISGNLPGIASEMFRVLRPYGGVLGQPEMANNLEKELSPSEIEKWRKQCSKPLWKDVGNGEQWAIILRGPLPGGGEWTHQYADPSNSACSGDRLLNDQMQIQWFGEPGPRPMIDRHHRALAPLWKDGRLFVPAAGENRIIAVDSYNGTILWDVEVPNYRRVGANKDAGNMVVTDDYLYVATEDNCWGLDVVTGKHQLTLKVAQITSERQWGYIANVGNLLFGSGQKKTASRTELSRETIGGIYYDQKPIVTSDYLFCLDRHTGKKLWHYKNGLIINPAIAVGDEHIYFVESRNPEAVDIDGKVQLKILLASGYGHLVALDMQTGDMVWEQQVDLPFEHIIHLSFANDTILALGTKNEEGHPRYDLFAFDADDGSTKWTEHFLRTDRGLNGGHGEQEQHAVIVGNTSYLYGSHSYNLQTGEKGSYKLNRGGHGCGTISGATSYLFGRGGNPRMYKIGDSLIRTASADNLVEENGIPLTQVNRPGCWINIIPAGGLVSIPEFSSGCTCSYPIQTSIAFVPKIDHKN